MHLTFMQDVISVSNETESVNKKETKQLTLISVKLQIIFCVFYIPILKLFEDESKDENDLPKNSAEDSDDCIIEDTHSGMTTRPASK